MEHRTERPCGVGPDVGFVVVALVLAQFGREIVRGACHNRVRKLKIRGNDDNDDKNNGSSGT